jgi:hypothetical protein
MLEKCKCKETELLVCNALVRFDNVPRFVDSGAFSRSALGDGRMGDVFYRDYLAKRNRHVERVERVISRDIQYVLKDDICRLAVLGIRPTLFLGFFSYTLDVLALSLSCRTLIRLAQEKRAFVMTFPSQQDDMRDLTIKLSAHFISILAQYEFSLEIM